MIVHSHSIFRQNPLLRFNDDGSISSRDGSFVINQDGTGHFASGRFKWSKDTIELRDVTIRWEDLDEEAQEQLKPRSVSLTGGTTFHYTNALTGECEPQSMSIIATEYNFEPESRRWEYLATEGACKYADNNSSLFELPSDYHGWEGRDVLTLRYTALLNDEEYTSTHTIFKLYDGEPTYSVYVESKNSTTFRNGIVSTTLVARVYRGGEVAPVYNFGCYEATKNTYGIMVYQERFMSVAHTFGGFDLGKTDYLRKAIGKKKADLMASLKSDFITGAIKNGCPEFEAEEIWQKIETAGKYSFNRSHAAAYALTAFCGAWLKANYPTAFYTVALQWADDNEIPALMSEMERCSVAKIVLPDINHSTVEFYTDYTTNEIFWSLNRIKFVGARTAEYIVTERARGSFKSIEDFIKRIFRRKLGAEIIKHWDETDPMSDNGRVPVNTCHLKHMILAGCFDRIENVKAVTERYAILKRAADTLNFKLRDSDAPEELRDKHYFWSQQQIAVSGIGSIDYRRIFSNSPDREKVKGKATYISLADMMRDENDSRKVAVCATVAEYSEHNYTDRESSGMRKRFVKLILSQNNQTVECTLWDDFYQAHKTELQQIKGKIIILTAVIRYSDYTAGNALQSYRNSLLFIQ